jgi:hypothetical protein
MSDVAWGVILLVAFALCHWLGIFAAIRTIMAIVGVILLGFSGFIGHIMVVIATFVAHLTDTVTGWAFGVAVPAIPVVILGIILLHDLHPKNGARKRTGIIGLALAVLIVAGATGIGALNHAASGVHSTFDSVKTSVGG